MDFAKYTKVRNEKFGAVIFDTLNEKVYVTNQSGDKILRLVADGLDLPAIVASLRDEYGEESPEMEADVAEFIDGLRSAGLLAPAMEDEA